MPKETFKNLPEEKRQLIEKVAIREFGTFGYDKASVNRIVDNCQIAKGSFYQYFDDKKDLFLYLIARVNEKKLESVSPVFQNPQKYDFFTLIRSYLYPGLNLQQIILRAPLWETGCLKTRVIHCITKLWAQDYKMHKIYILDL